MIKKIIKFFLGLTIIILLLVITDTKVSMFVMADSNSGFITFGAKHKAQENVNKFSKESKDIYRKIDKLIELAEEQFENNKK